MANTLIQRNFSSGEVAPGLYARADQARYAAGLRTCRNFLVKPFGPISNRPGSRHVCEVKDSDDLPALLWFVFSDQQSYVLEFGDGYLRIIQAGALVEVADADFDDWSGATAYEIGDLAEDTGVVYYCIADHTNQSPPDTTYWYALTGTIYEIPTPYDIDDVSDLNITQSADVLTIVHPAYPVQELRRYAATTWILVTPSFNPSINAPTGLDGDGSAGPEAFTYSVTSIDEDTGEESLDGVTTALTATINDMQPLTGTRSTICVVTTAAPHGFTTGQRVGISGVEWLKTAFTVVGSPNKRVYTLTVIDATHFKIKKGIFSTNYVSGGVAAIEGFGISLVKFPSTADPIQLTWDLVDGAKEYNVYREIRGLMGYIGSARNGTFIDDGITPDTTLRPPVNKRTFEVEGEYPAAVSHYQQRQVFGGSDDEPVKVKSSRTGVFHNFTVSIPFQDDDAVSFEIAGHRMARVRHLLDLGKLVILTDSGEYVANGDGAGSLTPVDINLRQQGRVGSSKVAPALVGDSAVFVQARGSRLRDLRYDYQSDGYHGEDLSIFAPHLVDGYTITGLAYAQEPYSIVWAIRSDGTLLGLTYVREQAVTGWHRHDSATAAAASIFERVVSIPEGDEDAVYVIVRRLIDGDWVRHIERFASRKIVDLARDAFFVDDGITYDGTNASDITLTLSTATTWLAGVDLTLTASDDLFTEDDVGTAFDLRLYNASGVKTATLRVTVTDYTSETVVTVTSELLVVAAFRSVPFATWAHAISEIEGLDHLEGEAVAVLSDGNVVDGLVVTDGAITLTELAAVVHVGLPIEADAETLELEMLQAETLSDKRKRIQSATLLVEASRGFEAGTEVAHLRPWLQRTTERYDDPTAPFTGPVEIALDSSSRPEARIFVRQSDPLPLTILAIAPRAQIGG